jgi:molybdopterin/thiamine biosynthesis adenylyltransferase
MGDAGLHPTVLLFVGDEQVGPGERVVLRDGDVVTVLLPVAGGAGEPLTDEDRARYAWQLPVPGFGEEGQRRLKGASVLVSRCGGVGGSLAYQLAAAGVGRLVLAHAGDLRVDDLNRQLLMTHDAVGTPRAGLAARRLRELNPHVEAEAVGENVSEANVARLVGAVDLVASCAPLFAERLLMSREAVRQGKPLVDCAMYELHAQVTTVLPGRTPCLACLYPEEPPHWRRRFPVLGAVAGVAGCLGAVEVIKVLAGLGEPLAGRMLLCDLTDMSFRRVTLKRRPGCPVCGGA